MESTSGVQNDATGDGGEIGGVVEEPLFRNGPSISIPIMSPSQPPAKPTPNSLQYIINEATGFTTEIKRLSGLLAAAEQKIAEQEATIYQQNINLSEAADIMTEQQRKIETLEEEMQQFGGGDRIIDLKELKAMAAKERKEKGEIQERYESLKSSVKGVTGEFNVFMEEMKSNFLEGEATTSKESNGESSQVKLDRLSDYVQNKFVTWTQNQIKLKAELVGMHKVVQNLAKMLESKNLATLQKPKPAQLLRVAQQQQRKSANLVSTKRDNSSNRIKLMPPPPPPKLDISPPKIINSNVQHGEDLSKRSQGFFCLCNQSYSTLSNLRIHIRTFTEEGKFKCQVCTQRFVLYYMLRRHLKDKHNITPPCKGGRTVGCADCGKVYANYINLYEHRKIAHSRKSKRGPSTSNLNETFPPAGSSMEYDNDAAGVDYDDDDDDISFIEQVEAETKVPLSLIKTEWPEGGRRQLISFSGKMHGMNIAKRHQGFYCICGIQFINRKRLDGHVQFQNKGQRKYADDLSDASDYEYEDQEEININPEPEDVIHNENNEQEEQENVGQGQGADEEVEVMKHMVHPARPSECVCGYDSHDNKYNLTKHIKYYTIERKFSCDYCSRRFVNTSYLRYHIIRSHKHVKMDAIMRIKTGCSRCGRTFPNMQAFNRHRKIVHGTGAKKLVRKSAPPKLTRRPVFSRTPPRGQFTTTDFRRPTAQSSSVGKFVCTHCNMAFQTLHQRTRHMKGVHNIVQTGYVIGCVDCGISFTTRREHAQHRITVHHSAIGKTKKAQQMKAEQSEPPPPHLKVQQQVWSTPPVSPEPIPVNNDMDEEEDESSTWQDESSADPEYFPEVEPTAAGVHQVDTSKEHIGNYCVCGASFNEKKNLFSHIRRKTQKWNFKCDLCHQSFFYNAALRRHKLTKHNIKNIYSSRRKQIGCVICGTVFQTWFQMRQHVKYNHNQTNDGAQAPTPGPSSAVTRTRSPRRSTSSTFQEESNSPPEVEQPTHGVDVLRANVGHYCLCGKPCNSERALNIHIKYHARERKLPCPVCNKLFICSSYLKQHFERTHKNATHKREKNGVTLKLFRCRQCGKTFKRNMELFRHNRTVHANTRTIGVGERRRVGRPASFYRTVAQGPGVDGNLHQPVEPQNITSGYACSCGKKYFNRSGLQKHIRIQIHGKVFKCSLCPKVYAEHGSLKVHLKNSHNIITDNGQHGCGICAQIFPSHGDVLQHRIQVHGRSR